MFICLHTVISVIFSQFYRFKFPYPFLSNNRGFSMANRLKGGTVSGFQIGIIHLGKESPDSSCYGLS